MSGSLSRMSIRDSLLEVGCCEWRPCALQSGEGLDLLAWSGDPVRPQTTSPTDPKLQVACFIILSFPACGYRDVLLVSGLAALH